MLNFSKCQVKHLLGSLLQKLEDNNLSEKEVEAINNLFIELNTDGQDITNYLSNKEFMNIFYLSLFMLKNPT